jgi:WhiB family transcriptional regulator, redox-sensing transcriptional regulator
MQAYDGRMEYDSLLPSRGDLSWQDHAACKNMGTDLFFPTENLGGPRAGSGIKGEAARIRQAKAVCFACPVRIRCLDYAVANACLGIWGMTTDRERARLARKQDAA